jgi:hypothetical protein
VLRGPEYDRAPSSAEAGLDALDGELHAREGCVVERHREGDEKCRIGGDSLGVRRWGDPRDREWGSPDLGFGL